MSLVAGIPPNAWLWLGKAKDRMFLPLYLYPAIFLNIVPLLTCISPLTSNDFPIIASAPAKCHALGKPNN